MSTEYALNLDAVKPRSEHFGVMLQTCVFHSITRGQFNTDRGWNPGPWAEQAGYEVTPMNVGKENGSSFFMTVDQAQGSTAPIVNVSLRLQRPEDQVLYAEKAVYEQLVQVTRANITHRLAEAAKNGSFDVFAETVLEHHVSLLQQLIDSVNLQLAAD